jgi:uncharacterized protein (TIRG00374 family)
LIKNPTLKKILRWLPGVLISLAAIFFLLKYISLDDLLQAFRSLKFMDILILVVIMLLSLITRSLGWKNLLDGVSFWQAFQVVNEGYLFNNLIPRSGEIVRTLLISGLSKTSAFRVASSVIVERALDVIIAASMFLLTLPFAVEMGWIKTIAWVLFSCFLAVIIALAVMARNSTAVIRWLNGLKIKSAFIHDKVIPKFESVLDGLAVLNNPLKLIKSIFWILASWVCWTSLLYFGMTLMTEHVPFWWAIFAQSVLALGIALPSAPAGLGVYEGTLVASLAVFGFDQNSSLSIALSVHFIQILITMILGISALLIQGQSISSLLDRIRIQKPAEKND